MGDTLPPSRRGHALEGVSRHGRAAPVCGPPARGREDGAAVRRVRDLAQDGLQDLRSLQRLRRRRVQRSQPAPLSASESTAAAAGSDDCPVETGVPGVGAPKIREKLRRQSTAPHLPATQSTDSSTSRFRQGRTSLRSRCHEVFAVNRLHSKDRHAGCLTTLPP